MAVGLSERLFHRAARRRARLLVLEERREERRRKLVPSEPYLRSVAAHPAGDGRGSLQDRVAAFMDEIEPIDSRWF